jgi:hypothetical protein
MSQQQGGGTAGKPIPRRPTQSPEHPPSLPKRPTFQSVEESLSPPESTIEGTDEVVETTQPAEQLPFLLKPAPIPSDEEERRFLLAAMATVKSEVPLGGKSRANSYSAVVHGTGLRSKTLARSNVLSRVKLPAAVNGARNKNNRSRKRGFLTWAIPFLK